MTDGRLALGCKPPHVPRTPTVMIQRSIPRKRSARGDAAAMDEQMRMLFAGGPFDDPTAVKKVEYGAGRSEARRDGCLLHESASIQIIGEPTAGRSIAAVMGARQRFHVIGSICPPPSQSTRTPLRHAHARRPPACLERLPA